MNYFFSASAFFVTCCNILCTQTKFLQQINSRTGMTEFVIYADANYRNRTAGSDSLCNCAAQTADDAVFFNCYQQTGFRCCLADQFRIQRLDCVNVQYTCVDASASSISAAFMDSQTIRPVATSVTSVPSRRVIPFPIVTDRLPDR